MQSRQHATIPGDASLAPWAVFSSTHVDSVRGFGLTDCGVIGPSVTLPFLFHSSVKQKSPNLYNSEARQRMSEGKVNRKNNQREEEHSTEQEKNLQERKRI